MLTPEPSGRAESRTTFDVTEQVHDAARLAALRNLDLLDSQTDPIVARLMELATRLVGVPVSVVSLADIHHQFFLDREGLTEESDRTRQIPLSHSLCQHAVATKKPLIVEDATKDPTLGANGAIRDPDVNAYAGMPLILRSGHVAGVLFAIDDGPRSWTADQLEIIEGLTETVRDVLELRGELATMGIRDRLTGLPNRALLVAYTQELLSGSEDDQLVAVICAGVDHFNQINQAFGTDNADEVLKAVADQLESSLEEDHVFGRLRGDTFTAVIPALTTDEDAVGLALRMRAELADGSLTVEGSQVTLGVTAGVATGHRGANAADLISEAANAMRRAKRDHVPVHLAEEGWSEQAVEHLRLREALTEAIERGYITAAFQPIVDLETGEVAGLETLARWTDPELGVISPTEFVPLAEVTSEIIPIGELMLDTALDELGKWRSQGYPELGATINIAPLQLEQPKFAEIVGSALERAGLPGDAIGLEITEGALLESGSVQQRNLERVSNLGVRIVLDDFGTGYSALSYLSRFPIDVIKIDRAFVADMTTDRTAAALVQAVLGMAKAMDLEIVAEGIETSEQSNLLRLLGCRFGQGFFFARPSPAAEVDLGPRRS